MDAIRRGLTVVGWVLAATLLVAVAAGAEPFQPDGFGPGQDARAYWVAPMDSPYAPASVGRESAYLYSPAFLQAMAPLRMLDWTAFLVVWMTILLLVLYRLVGPILFGPAVVLTLPELWGGNVTLLMAAAIVIGFRWAGSWSFVLLTKVTPALGLAWFLVRREWRPLAWAALATMSIVAVSAVFAPDQWRDWLSLLSGSVGSSTVPGSVPVPLWLRLPFALAVIVFAARTDRAWLLPLGALLAMPIIWWGSFSMLAASVALRRDELERWLVVRLASFQRPLLVGPAHSDH
jgi:hypothetical protein